MISRIMVVLALCVVGTYCICEGPGDPLDQGFRFYSRGKTCDGFYPGLSKEEGGCTQCCKNWLACMNFNNGTGVCVEPAQGANCTTNAMCGSNIPGSMVCLKSSVLEIYGVCGYLQSLATGESCTYDQQCQKFGNKPQVCGPAPAPPAEKSGLRSSLSSYTNGYGYRRTADVGGICYPDSGINGTACADQSDCAAGYWCNPLTQLCSNRLVKNANCSAGANIITPNYVCAAGLGCVQTKEGDDGSYECRSYYGSGKNSQCTLDNWWNCQYGYYCNAANFSVSGVCKEVNMNNAIGDDCKQLPFTAQDQKSCPWGAGCDCFSSSKVGKGECTRMFNTNCEDELGDYVKCVKKAGCPHDPVTLIGHSESPFAGTIITGSCAYENCLKKHGTLIHCQNNDVSSSKSPARNPSTFPNNQYSSSSGGLAGWEIGLIIVGVAVAVIIIVVVVVAVVRRKKSHAPGYDTLA